MTAWPLEYDGFDPGYETLGIQYLARYWEKTRDARVLASLRRAVAFFAHAVHPDGSVGGAYGSRHTRLYFPAGFEILAGEIPEAASVLVGPADMALTRMFFSPRSAAR